MNPGAEEICDGVDNNCDGEVDEGVTSTYYADTDGDGFGDAESTTDSCEQPDGYAPIGTDCDDSSAESYPSAPEQCDDEDNDCDGEIDEDITDVWYADADSDGYGDPKVSIETCDPDQGYVATGDDCDDTDAAAFPGSKEVCDEADNDCDGTIDEGVTGYWFEDADGDGFGDDDTVTESCGAPSGYVITNADCDDTDDTIHPDADEICDGIDNDCDTYIDDVDSNVVYVDKDGSALIWYIDADGDTFGSAAFTYEQCEQPSGFVDDDTDCDDTDDTIHPDATEVCDSVDNDCDGSTDGSDAWWDEGFPYRIPLTLT